MDAIRYDGLANALTALGDPDVDTRKVTTRSAPVQRTVFELEGEFAESWMANKEVSAIPAAMYRPGFTLTNVKPATLDVSGVQSILEGEQKVGANGQIDRQRGLLWYAWQNTEQGNKLGGSALLVIVDDGLDPIEPLDTRRIQRVVGWEVLDRYEISPWLGSGLNSEPEYYVLTDVLRHSTSALKLQPGHIIHRSRLWINPGKLLSRREMRARGWWGASVLELNWEPRRGAEESLQYLLTYMDRASWLHMQIAELNELLKMKDSDGVAIGESAVRTRMKTMRMCTRTFGIAVTDGGKQGVTNQAEQISIPGRAADKLESVGESVGSLPEIEARARENWQAGWGAPKSIAFGDGTNGLRGGDNKGDQQTWEGMRRDGLQDGGIEQVNWMLLITFAAKEGPTGGVIPDWTLEPKPLYVATPAEKAAEQKLVADADHVRIADGVVDADEVREQRMVLGDHDGHLRAMKLIGKDQAGKQKLIGVVTGLLDAGSKVYQNEMSAEYMAWVLPRVDPTITPEAALQGAEAARNKALPVANAALTGTVAVGQDQAAGAEDMVTDEEVGLFSSDPIPVGGLMKAREIKDRLRAEGFLGMTTQRIKKLARDKVIRVWDQLGSEPGFSLQDVVDELQRRNGKPEPEGVEEPGVTEEDRADSTAPIWRRWWVRWQPVVD